jgi:serpin B
VDVKEEGTQAAAATAVIMAPGAGAIPRDQKQAVFRADHPFLYLIRENSTGSILFIGRVAKPGNN